MLKRLSELFVTILTSCDLFIHHHGLSAFTKFAEETLHEAVVPSCIEDQPGLQDYVVQFINKVVILLKCKQSTNIVIDLLTLMKMRIVYPSESLHLLR